MKISSVITKKLELQLKEPYTIAYQTVSQVINVLIEIFSDSNLKGVGVSAPEEEVTKENWELVTDIINQEVDQDLIHLPNIDNLQNIIFNLLEKYKNYPATIAGVDFALHSLHANYHKCTISELIGKKYNSKVTTSITINILDLESTLKKAKFWLAQGFKILKIKGGLDVENDIRKLYHLKEKISDNLAIMFDANQGYSFEESLYFLNETKKLKLILLEQPVKKNLTSELIELANLKITPIMADESACSIEDINFLVNHGVQYINLKLMKCGGLLAGKQIIESVLSKEAKIVISCMDECALSNSFSLALALSFKEIKFVDLDSFTDYLNDPTAKCIILKDGELSLPSN